MVAIVRVEVTDIDVDTVDDEKRAVDAEDVLNVVVVVVLPGHAGKVVSSHRPFTMLQCDNGHAPPG